MNAEWSCIVGDPELPREWELDAVCGRVTSTGEEPGTGERLDMDADVGTGREGRAACVWDGVVGRDEPFMAERRWSVVGDVVCV